MTTDTMGWDLVASRLQREIDERGLTLKGIERDAGVAFQTLQKLLEGKEIRRRDSLRRLAELFGWRGDAWDRIRDGKEPVAETTTTVQKLLPQSSALLQHRLDELERRHEERLAALERQVDDLVARETARGRLERVKMTPAERAEWDELVAEGQAIMDRDRGRVNDAR